MDAYLVTLYVGFSGLLLMAVLGWSHAALGHGGHAHRGGASVRHHPTGHKASLQTRGNHGDGLTSFIAHLISPVVIFSLVLGFGATGVLLRPFAAHWPIFLLPTVAAVDAGLFERYLVQPIWRLLFGFASAPAQTLESLVQEEGRAVTNFDATGAGLIVVDLDGQVRQLLGNLVPGQRGTGERVRSGDRVVICAVDPRRNSCTVARL